MNRFCQGVRAGRTQCRWACMAGLVALIIAGTGHRAVAQTATVAPARDAAGNLVRQGYTVQIDDDWPAQHGYRPVTISIQANPPLADDATVTVQMESMHRRGVIAHVVEQDFILPSGQQNPAKFTMSVPASRDAAYYRHSFWVDGFPQPDLAITSRSDISSYFRRRHVLHVVSQEQPGLFENVLPEFAAQKLTISRLPANTLPERWLDYTSVSVVCIGRDDLIALVQEHPEQWQTLRRWVQAGGNLWIDQMGSDLQTWPEMARLLRLPEEGILTDRPDSPDAWQKPRINFVETWQMQESMGSSILLPTLFSQGSDEYPSDFVVVDESGNQVFWDEVAPSFSPIDKAPLDTETPISPFAPDPEFENVLILGDSGIGMAGAPSLTKLGEQLGHLRECSLGIGHVVLIGGDWLTPLELLIDENLVPSFAMPARLDPSLASDRNIELWSWPIPDVGKPPIAAFQILISLFVVTIGPLNYFMLRRMRRLHWLVVTVPLSALLVTGALIGYAVIADGFGTLVRIRSFTLLDQQHGEAVCLSRQTYYAGIAPAAGLHFPADMAVYYQSEAGSHPNTVYKTIWEDDQHLTEGWLPSRTMTQFSCRRSRATSARLEIETAPGTAPIVTNRLGTPIHALLLSDGEGNVYGAADIAVAAQATLHDGTVPAASRTINQAIDSNLLHSISTSRTYLLEPTNLSYLEWLIDRVGQATIPNPFSGLAPHTYIALVEKSPEVEFGCEAEQVHSLHLIWGSW